MNKFSKTFFHSIGLLLFITACAKILTIAHDSKILQLVDPVIGIRTISVLIGVISVELIVTFLIVEHRSIFIKGLVTIWISLCFALYKTSLYLLAPEKPCRCLGELFEWTNLKDEQMAWVSNMMIIYMLAGSIIIVAYHLRKKDNAFLFRNFW